MPIDAEERDRLPVLGALIDALSWPDAIDRLVRWGDARSSRYVCICNVHSVVTAAQDPAFMQVLNNADMATPDGMPVAWMLRRLGRPSQQRINGPDLMYRYLAEAQQRGQVVSFYGSTPDTLQQLRGALLKAFPGLRIGTMISPPFRALLAAEQATFVEQINAAGTAVLFVGLGCPKQEGWMADQRGSVHAVMVGVGAAFDYHAGTVSRAPRWMQNAGLEWLHRLASEPRRLWKRYLLTNTQFVGRAIRQLMWMGRRQRGLGKTVK
jgi:N-acetylglucosaminyldiphosphoundecaprenol N-acetyl-beta-D-mannosaminyltransferase